MAINLGFIYKDYKLGPVYTGQDIASTLSIQESLNFLKINPTELQTYTLQDLYGTQYEFKRPAPPSSYDPEQDTNITQEVYDQILTLSNLNQINDYVVGLWSAITKNFDIFQTSTHQIYILPTTKEHRTLDQAPIILAKDALLGLYNPDPLMYKNQEIPISTDYTLQDPRAVSQTVSKTQSVGQTESNQEQHPSKMGTMLTFKHNFSAGLRNALLSRMLKSWNEDPKNVNFQRDTLLQSWQIDSLKRMEHRTVILAPRRSGKSLFMALLALTQLMSYNHKKGVRPRTILYLSKDTATYKTVLDYIQATIDNVEFLKEFFYYNSKDAIFYFRDPDSKQVYGQIKFLTAEGKTPGVGSAADWVFIDEAMMIKESVFKRIEPICTHEGAGLTVVSTFYDHLEDGDKVYDWPVKLCNEYEKTSSQIQDIDEHILTQYDNFIKHGERPPLSEAGLRYTIDDVDVITNKERIKELYQTNFDIYMKELYCRAPQKKTLFNFRPHIVTANYDQERKSYLINQTINQPNYWDLILVCYDPARTGDMSALTTIGYSKIRQKIQVIKEQQLNFVDKSSFLTQVPQIQQALKRAKDHSHSTQFCMDGSHPGVQDVLIGQGIIPFRSYKWCGGMQQKNGKNPFEFNTPKRLMVEALQFLLDNNKVEIWDSCPITIDQLDKYVEIVNPHTNQSKFEGAQSTHDDFVASLLVGAWTLYDAYDFKYQMPKSNLKEFTNSIDKSLTKKPPIIANSMYMSFNFIY